MYYPTTKRSVVLPCLISPSIRQRVLLRISASDGIQNYLSKSEFHIDELNSLQLTR